MEKDKKLWRYTSVLFWIVLIICILYIKSISAIQKQNEGFKKDVIKINQMQIKTNGGFVVLCKKLKDENKEQQKVIDKLNHAMFGEEKIGENPE